MNSPFKLPNLFLHFDHFSRDGFFLRRHSEPGHSWVRNAYNYFFAAVADCGGDAAGAFGAGYLSSKNTVGTVYDTDDICQDRLVSGVPGTSGMVNSAASSAFGLIVGSDDTAFSLDQYSLGALIEHGSGAGQLSYGVQAAPVLDYTSLTWTASHVRTFSNLSGSAIFVKEVGLLRKQAIFSPSSYFLMSRDVLSEVQEVAPLAVLQLTIEISHDFSTIDS